MDGIRRKVLSIGNRKRCKRSTPSSQDLFRDVPSPEPKHNTSNSPLPKPSYQSPSIVCTSNCDLECTPPRTKFGLDDSFDHCPHTLDDSFSPSIMLSQTLSTESPEVSWKWKHSTSSSFDKAATTSHSNNGADGSCASVGLNGVDACRFARSGIDAAARRQKLERRQRDEKYILEQNKRKAEKLKMDEVLKRRFAEIQEQLKEKKERCPLENAESNKISSELSEKAVGQTCRSSRSSSTPPSRSSTPCRDHISIPIPTTSVEETNTHESIDPFFNDSESDCLLLEATQELESQIIRLTQSPLDNNRKKRKALDQLEPTAVNTTPKSSNKKKPRSSLYLKFLEDDSADDWFVSLDHSAFEVTQSKNRSSLQRYKSMPAENISSSSKACVQPELSKIACTSSTNNIEEKSSGSSASRKLTSNFKRHASSNIESPLRTICKIQQEHTG